MLQVREIRDLNLAADLVTLSACDTGVGALEGEEGIANLVRAFLFARAKSVVASLWAASDVYTRNLMQHFYWYIAAGEDKGSALRHAQLDLIKQFGDQAMPFYWAGFIMIGDGSSRIPISPNRARVGHSPRPQANSQPPDGTSRPADGRAAALTFAGMECERSPMPLSKSERASAI